MSSDIGTAGYWDTSPVQTCKRCLTMFDNVVQCETWRQLVSLSAGKSVLIDCWNAFSTGTSPSPGIAQHRQTWLTGLVQCCRVWWCRPSLRLRLLLLCLHVWPLGHWARHQLRFYNNKYKHKRGGVIVFTFIFMLKTSIYRGDGRIYLCGVESK